MFALLIPLLIAGPLFGALLMRKDSWLGAFVLGWLAVIGVLGWLTFTDGQSSDMGRAVMLGLLLGATASLFAGLAVQGTRLDRQRQASLAGSEPAAQHSPE